MTDKEKLSALKQAYSLLLLKKLKEKATQEIRSYGFEYEFLPDAPLTLAHMERLYKLLPDMGYVPAEDYFRHSSGLSIAFEPGGQIEYHSPPVFQEDAGQIQPFLAEIEKTNRGIHQKLGIQYVGTGYLPGRADAPLCLTTQRYKNLHARMSKAGSRGLEMMKGTASIHLHVVVRRLSEVFPLFSLMCALSQSDGFKMQKDRRDIWNNTDPSRCGLPYRFPGDQQDADQVIEQVVAFAFEAEDIEENKVFYKTADTGFDAFLYHLTTIFTDVRLNLKGPTVELRTIDSMPIHAFQGMWEKFISSFEHV